MIFDWLDEFFDRLKATAVLRYLTVCVKIWPAHKCAHCADLIEEARNHVADHRSDRVFHQA